jgi:CPA2 family monovalent cation:H+ antiporter-2
MIFLVDSVILLGSAILVAGGFHYLRFPAVIGFIASGILVGPSGFGLIRTPVEIELLTEITGVLLLFTIGLEFSFEKLFRYRKAFIWLGLGQILVTIVIVGWIAVRFFSMNIGSAIVWGCVFSLSSTAMVMKLLAENRDEPTPFGQSGISILLLQDIAVIPMILLLPLLAGGESLGTVTTFLGVLKVLLVVPAVYLGAGFIVPKLLEHSARTGSREMFFFSVIFVALSSSLLLHWVGLSFSLGAFVAGMIISESPYGHEVVSIVEPFRENFVGLFFIVLGMILNIGFLSSNIHYVLGIAFLIFLLKVIVVTGLVVILKNPLRLGIATGLLVSQIGEFSIILTGKAETLGIFTDTHKQYLLGVAILTLVLTPFIYKLTPKVAWTRKIRFPRLSQIPSWLHGITRLRLNVDLNHLAEARDRGAEDHALIVGFGVAGQNLAEVLKQLKLPYRIVELNAATEKKFRDTEPIYYGDATREKILRSAGIEKAKILIIAISGTHLARRILDAVRKIRPELPVLVRSHYLRELEELGSYEHTEFVVGEAETTLQILARVLSEYGVEEEVIHSFKKETREKVCISGTCVGIEP